LKDKKKKKKRRRRKKKKKKHKIIQIKHNLICRDYYILSNLVEGKKRTKLFLGCIQAKLSFAKSQNSTIGMAMRLRTEGTCIRIPAKERNFSLLQRSMPALRPAYPENQVFENMMLTSHLNLVLR
jgi:hypothetical protein